QGGLALAVGGGLFLQLLDPFLVLLGQALGVFVVAAGLERLLRRWRRRGLAAATARRLLKAVVIRIELFLPEIDVGLRLADRLLILGRLFGIARFDRPVDDLLEDLQALLRPADR